MKKIILAIAICAAGLTSVKGQVAKGNLFIGTGLGTTTYNFGTFNYNYSDGNIKSQNEKNYSLDLSPQLGVFLTSHLVFGGTLGLDYQHNKSNFSSSNDVITSSNVSNNATNFTLGPFLRYYFFNSNPTNTMLFIEGDAALGTGSGSTSETDFERDNSVNLATGNTSSMFIFKAGGSLGVTHMIQKNIGIDFAVGYLYDYEKNTTNLVNQTTTAGGATTSTPLTYKATMPENGISVSAGFHFMVP